MDVREIMTKDVITIRPETSVEEATDLLLKYHIHGAPVTGPQHQLLGMVSFVDLARHAGEAVTVKDVMTPDPVRASEDTPVEDVARLLTAIAGPDGNDPRQIGTTTQNYMAALNKGAKGLKIAVVTRASAGRRARR